MVWGGEERGFGGVCVWVGDDVNVCVIVKCYLLRGGGDLWSHCGNHFGHQG